MPTSELFLEEEQEVFIMVTASTSGPLCANDEGKSKRPHARKRLEKICNPSRPCWIYNSDIHSSDEYTKDTQERRHLSDGFLLSSNL